MINNPFSEDLQTQSDHLSTATRCLEGSAATCDLTSLTIHSIRLMEDLLNAIMDTPSTSKSEHATERDEGSPVVGEGSASTQVETKQRQTSEKAPKSKTKKLKSKDALKKAAKSKLKKAKEVVTSESDDSESLTDSGSDESDSSLSGSEEDSETETEKEKRKRKAKKKSKQKARDKRKAKSKRKARKAVRTLRSTFGMKADIFSFPLIPARTPKQYPSPRRKKIQILMMMKMTPSRRTSK